VVVAFIAVSCGRSSSPVAPTSSVVPQAAGRYEVSIAGGDVVVGGILFRPDGADARPGIIVLHGWQAAGTNGAAVVEARARRYAEDGYVALAMSMRGWPPSGGADDCGLRQPDDVARALRWLGSLPGVIADRLALVGFSQGGQVALLAGALEPRPRAVVAYFPVTDIARWKTDTAHPDIPSYITAVCEPGGAERRSPLAEPARLQVPVMLVHGDRDTRVPTDQSARLHGARRGMGLPSELLLVPGAQHGFTAAEDAIARPVVEAFLATWLR
jgi:dipeptidyl aminopeptidase/acylaminoacyl peptidase